MSRKDKHTELKLLQIFKMAYDEGSTSIAFEVKRDNTVNLFAAKWGKYEAHISKS